MVVVGDKEEEVLEEVEMVAVDLVGLKVVEQVVARLEELEGVEIWVVKKEEGG